MLIGGQQFIFQEEWLLNLVNLHFWGSHCNLRLTISRLKSAVLLDHSLSNTLLVIRVGKIGPTNMQTCF